MKLASSVASRVKQFVNVLQTRRADSFVSPSTTKEFSLLDQDVYLAQRDGDGNTGGN